MKYYKIKYSFGGAVKDDIPNDTRVIIVKEGEHKDKIGVIKREGDQIYVDINGTRIDITLDDVTTEIEMKTIMFNATKELFSKLVDPNIPSSFQIKNPKYRRNYTKMNDSLVLREQFGVGIFTTNEYKRNELVLTDLSVYSYNFKDRWGFSTNKMPRYLDFYSKQNYGVTHALSGSGRGDYPLFPMMGLVNYSDNPNCLCYFKNLNANGDKKAVIGFLFALRDIQPNEELTISYWISYNELLDLCFTQLNLGMKIIDFDLDESNISLIRNLIDRYLGTYSSITSSGEWGNLFLDLIKLEQDINTIIEIIIGYNNEYLKYMSFMLFSAMKEKTEKKYNLIKQLIKSLEGPKKIKYERLIMMHKKVRELLDHEYFKSCRLILEETITIVDEDSLNKTIILLEKNLPN